MVEDSEIVETDSILSWMPLYHNIGLIVSHMLGIYCNIDSYLMSTELFIYRPYLWMEKISEHKVTLSCSLNFGYRYYLRGIMNRDCSGLDLSNLRIILNGAEPISLKACNTFLEMMKQYSSVERNVYHLHASGKRDYQSALQKYESLGLDKSAQCKLSDYIYDMPLQMAAADFSMVLVWCKRPLRSA